MGFGPKTARFQGRRFDDIEYYDPGSFETETYIRVNGKLLRDGSAVGSILYYNNPPSASPNRECTTATGSARWQAELPR